MRTQSFLLLLCLSLGVQRSHQSSYQTFKKKFARPGSGAGGAARRRGGRGRSGTTSTTAQRQTQQQQQRRQHSVSGDGDNGHAHTQPNPVLSQRRSAACSQHQSCTTCAANEACAWCKNLNECMVELGTVGTCSKAGLPSAKGLFDPNEMDHVSGAGLEVASGTCAEILNPRNGLYHVHPDQRIVVRYEDLHSLVGWFVDQVGWLYLSWLLVASSCRSQRHSNSQPTK